jgi:hypothetical protein
MGQPVSNLLAVKHIVVLFNYKPFTNVIKTNLCNTMKKQVTIMSSIKITTYQNIN